MRKKFKKRYIIIPLVCIIVIGGIVGVGLYKKQADSIAKVVSVTEVEQWFGDDSALSVYGGLKKGSVQNIIISDTLKVDEVKVEKGDTVKKGDTLLTYDTQSLELNVEEAENKITQIENEEKIANNELDVLKKLQPSENAPSDYEPIDDPEPETIDTPDTDIDTDIDITAIFKYTEEVNLTETPLGGNGSKDDPFVFNVTSDSIVSKEYLEFLSGGSPKSAESEDDAETEREAKYALLCVYSENGALLYSRLLDGSKITEEDLADWKCSDGIEITEDGRLSVASEQKAFVSLVAYLPYDFSGDIDTDIDDMFFDESLYDIDDYVSSYDDFSQEGSSTGEITLNDNYVYTSEELKKMIADKEAEIKQLGLDKKQADIDLQKAEKLLETGSETASMSGTVTFVASSDNDLSDSGAYIIIASDEGMSVTGAISEFQLDQIFVGMTVNITNYADGSMYSGEITAISDKPTDSNDYSYDSTASYYEFTANVDGDLDLKDDEGIEISIPSEDSASTLCVELAFVREENGKYYVMVANEDNVIEKRYVSTGRNYYGYAIEIKAGLSEDDRIALPYGKIQEGMPVKDVTYDDLYGLFF